MKKLAQKERIKISEKLIKAFQAKPQSDWRKLIAFSKQWPQLADSVFARYGVTVAAAPTYRQVQSCICGGPVDLHNGSRVI